MNQLRSAVDRPAVEQHDRRRAGRPGQLAHERGAPPGQLDGTARGQPTVGRMRTARPRRSCDAQTTSTARISTFSVPFGASYSTLSPARVADEGRAERRARARSRRARRGAPRWGRSGSARRRLVVALVADRDDRARPHDALGRRPRRSRRSRGWPRAGGCGPPSFPAPPWRRGSRRSRRGRRARGRVSISCGDLDPAARREVVVLGLEPLVRAPGQLVDVGHGRSRLPPGLTSIRPMATLVRDVRPRRPRTSSSFRSARRPRRALPDRPPRGRFSRSRDGSSA